MVIEEQIASFGGPKERVPNASLVRSTLIGSSIQALREHGYFERYKDELPGEWHDRVLSASAGVWLPFEIADVHYRACDRLALSNQDILGMGNAVCKLAERTVMAALLRMASEAGATPFTVLGGTPRVWARLFTGGAVASYKLGPKEARFETVGIPLAQIRYWRVGYRGLLTSLTEPFCTKMYIREIPSLCVGNDLAFRLSWA